MKKQTILLLVAIAWSAGIVADNSPYINRVYEFRPAPGQFTNLLPEYEANDTEEDMRSKAEEAIANDNQGMISLGGWGGYVVFGFDHMVVNVAGEYDLKILGNAFFANANPNTSAPIGGSAEPGIVMVSYDTNGNGIPDDEWYELAGSEYNDPRTVHNYTQTYYRTPEDHVATPDPKKKVLIDTTYVEWRNSLNEVGYVVKNSYHRQAYYPEWIEEETMTFTGTRCRPNGIDESGNGSYYVQYMFDWGYVDNMPNSTDKVPHPSEFNLEWAVDADGQPVTLKGIHFIKVYTAVNQQNGHLGECSTEVMGAEDLHPDVIATSLEEVSSADNNQAIQGVYDITGRYIAPAQSTKSLPNRVYIMRNGNGKTKKTIVSRYGK